jgi:anti-repressor protein
MNELTVFTNDNFGEIRTLQINGDVWFVAKDVADVLGYSDTQAMTRRLDEDETMTDILSGMNMKSTLINESGLYNSVIGSNKPEAKMFKKWITSEVLPSIRKNGGYILNQEKMTPEQIVANALIVAQNIINNQKLEIENKTKQLELAQPKVEFHDAVVGSDDTIDIGQVAKVLNAGIGRNKLFELLRDLDILRQNNEPYQKYIDNGWFRQIETKYNLPTGETKIYIKTVVFQKGVDAIRKILPKKGVVND